MSEMQLCAECHRHVRENDSVCPFCSATRRSVSGRGALRTAIVAGAIVGASALGCGDSKPAVEGPSGGGAGDQGQVVQSDAQVAAPLDSEAVVDAGLSEAREELPPMPYGAPPARKRLV